MSRKAKALDRILRGTSDANIRFTDLCGLMKQLGFEERIRGGHHIFTRDGVVEILNLQARDDGKAKAYQVRQVRDVIVLYGLALDAVGGEAEQPDTDEPTDTEGES